MPAAVQCAVWRLLLRLHTMGWLLAVGLSGLACVRGALFVQLLCDPAANHFESCFILRYGSMPSCVQFLLEGLGWRL